MRVVLILSSPNEGPADEARIRQVRCPAAVHETVLPLQPSHVGQPSLSPGGILEVVAAPVLGTVMSTSRLAGRIRRAAALAVLPLVALAVRVLAMGVVVAAGRDCRRLLSSVWSRLPMVSRGGLAWAEALWIPVDAVEEVYMS